MKTLTKAALLTSLGLAALTTAQAQYSAPDLILGFTGGSSSDVLFDLGTASNIGVGATGTTTSLNTSLSLALLSANGYTSLVGKSFGVIGYSGGANKGIYSTVSHGFTVPSVGNVSAFNGISLNIDDTGSFIDGNGSPANSAVVDKTDPKSWNSNVANPGANTFFNNYGNPDVSITGGTDVADLYFAKDNNSAPQFLGVFALDNSGNFSFTATPEPTASALWAASGLLLFAFRRFAAHKA